MRPMLLPKAGIYMVRGGGSCGDKHSMGYRVRYWRHHEMSAQEYLGSRCAHTSPGDMNLIHTYS